MDRSGRLLLFLVLLCGVGAYNYQRNAPLDQDLEDRPFKGMAEYDLEVLASAYEEEIESLRIELSRVGSPARRTHRPGDLLDERVQSFEEIRTSNERWKRFNRKVIDREIELEQIRKEQEIRRAGLHQEWRRIYRRLTSLDPL